MFCVKRCNMCASFCIQEMLSLSFNSQEGRSPFLGCPQQFVQYIRSYRPYRKGCLLHPQTEEGPRSGQSGNVKCLSLCAKYTVWPTFTFHKYQISVFLNSHISRNLKRHNKHTSNRILSTNTKINNSISTIYVTKPNLLHVTQWRPVRHISQFSSTVSDLPHHPVYASSPCWQYLAVLYLQLNTAVLSRLLPHFQGHPFTHIYLQIFTCSSLSGSKWTALLQTYWEREITPCVIFL
jgi:hypothetical protein